MTPFFRMSLLALFAASLAACSVTQPSSDKLLPDSGPTTAELIRKAGSAPILATACKPTISACR